MSDTRDDILRRVREALSRRAGEPAPALPATARVAPRAAGSLEAEAELFCAELRKLSGVAERLPDAAALPAALAALVKAEGVSRAAMWSTDDLAGWRVAETLRELGVELVPAQGDHRAVAACELGVTGADAALPETGTLVLRGSPERPRVVSLLPRVHLAILRQSALCADLHQGLAAVQSDPYAVFVTGPSRTADIELTLTLGVHGPRSLYAWLLPG
jgi:L-lactate dehydrogenase complex protein LldG